MPARAIDTATIAFGLVSIPIKIYSTSEPSHEIHFHLIHEGCGERLKQQYICPRHGVVERADMTKGFELTKGNFVELEKEELKALEAVASDEVAIREFVPATAIDPIFVDRTYYLGPDKGGERAYGLLRDALTDAELVGVAAYSARGKQYIVMVRPFEDGLAMHQLRYADEVKSWSEVPLGKLPKAAAPELRLAAQIIEQLQHETFDATEYKDDVKDRVRKLIAKKAKGGEIVAAPEAPKPVVTDLMEALKASLAGEARAPARDDRVSVVRSGRNGKSATAERRGHAAKRATTGHAAAKRPARAAAKRPSRARPHATRARSSRAGAKRAHR
jgi:DNA end-binding protein Ku